MTARTLEGFQIGDRVVVIDYALAERRTMYISQTGTVAGFSEGWIVVDHDEKFSVGLDTCDGVVKSGRGWIYYPKELELIAQAAPTPVDDLL